MSELVETLLEPVLSGQVQIVVRDRIEASTESRGELDAIAEQRLIHPTTVARRSGVLSTTATVNVSAVLAEAVADQVARAAAEGREISPGGVLDAAICRMLDALSEIPWCRACLELLEHCDCRGGRVPR